MRSNTPRQKLETDRVCTTTDGKSIGFNHAACSIPETTTRCRLVVNWKGSLQQKNAHPGSPRDQRSSGQNCASSRSRGARLSPISNGVWANKPPACKPQMTIGRLGLLLVESPLSVSIRGWAEVRFITYMTVSIVDTTTSRIFAHFQSVFPNTSNRNKTCTPLLEPDSIFICFRPTWLDRDATKR